MARLLENPAGNGVKNLASYTGASALTCLNSNKEVVEEFAKVKIVRFVDEEILWKSLRR
jgi:hypothetical protein